MGIAAAAVDAWLLLIGWTATARQLVQSLCLEISN